MGSGVALAKTGSPLQRKKVIPSGGIAFIPNKLGCLLSGCKNTSTFTDSPSTVKVIGSPGSPGALVHLIDWFTWNTACTGSLVQLVHWFTGSLVHWFTGSLVQLGTGSAWTDALVQLGTGSAWTDALVHYSSAGALVQWFCMD